MGARQASFVYTRQRLSSPWTTPRQKLLHARAEVWMGYFLILSFTTAEGLNPPSSPTLRGRAPLAHLATDGPGAWRTSPHPWRPFPPSVLSPEASCSSPASS